MSEKEKLYSHLLRETIERLKIKSFKEYDKNDCSFCVNTVCCEDCYEKYPYIHNICKSYGKNEFEIFHGAEEIIELLEEELKKND